jgi:hypothetical protein
METGQADPFMLNHHGLEQAISVPVAAVSGQQDRFIRTKDPAIKIEMVHGLKVK